MTEAGISGAAAKPPQAATVRVWDPLVRLVHWSLALAIVLNATVVEDESLMHEVIGYAAVGLVLVRLLWGLIGTEHARFRAFPPNPVAAIRYLASHLSGRHQSHLSHNPAGALMAYNLWATVIGMGITGYMMGTVRFFGYDWVEELHEGLFTWLLISIGLHLAGVVLDTLVTRRPLVPAMFHGKKPKVKER